MANVLLTLLVATLIVLPGYIALRGRARVLPRVRRPYGFAGLLAEFLVFTAAAHVLVLILYAVVWILTGTLSSRGTWYFAGEYFHLSGSGVLTKLSQLPAIEVAIYLFVVFVAAWLLGLGVGLFRAWRPVGKLAARLGWAATPLGRFWVRQIQRFLVISRPVVYDALFPELDEHGEPRAVFAELEMKEQLGTITGRVTGFSIADNEEGHQMVYLEDIYRRTPGSHYHRVDSDGMLVDLADAMTIEVKQV